MPPKSVAQRSKEYRDNKKSSPGGAAWKEKEVNRDMKYYKYPGSKDQAAIERRREINRMSQARRRQRLKESAEKEADDSSTYDDGPSQMQVKMPFSSPKSRSRKRISRVVASKNREIRQLLTQKTKSDRRVWKLQKRLERLKKKITVEKRATSGLNPKEKAERDLRRAGLCPGQHQHLLKKLTAHHALLTQIKSRNSRRITKRKQLSVSVLAGRITRKYRLFRYLGLATRTNRNHLSGQQFKKKKTRQTAVREQLMKKVLSFYERDDISRLTAGKKEATRTGRNSKVQTRVLLDYQKNNWNLFRSEFPQCKISLAVFCRMRPSYIRLTSFTSRNVCLCSYHQNIALKMKAIGLRDSPDFLVSERENDQIIAAADIPNEVTFYSWERVKDRNQVKCIQKTLTKSDFVELFQADLQRFRQHVYRIKEQHRNIKLLKESLTPNEVIVQMDFSENFSCRSVDEVQSAYWNQSQVTIHPCVFYFRENADDPIKHRSQVHISDVMQHNTTTVIAIMREVNHFITSIQKEVTTVHYITDSPTSQYRNKYVFHMIANHQQFFNRKATWTYHEVGHGKGPCDGLGGTLKRAASEAVKQGKVIISNATEMYEWCQQNMQTSMKFHLLTQNEVEKAATIMSRIQDTAQAIHGTLSIHAVISLEPGMLMVKETARFCPSCRSGEMCEGWDSIEVQRELDYSHGSWVAAEYESAYYIGLIIQNRSDLDQCEVSFMLSSGTATHFQWPQPKDIIWMEYNEIICNVQAPVPMPGRKRSKVFYMDPLVLANVEKLLEKRLES